MSDKRAYTFEEVKKASTGNRTVIVVNDKVYDVTAFLNEHPGGEEILLDHAGKDATEDFNDVGHSTDAIELMAKFHVGDIVEAERRNLPKKDGWRAGHSSSTPENDKYVSGPGAPFAMFAGAVVLAIVAIMYFAF